MTNKEIIRGFKNDLLELERSELTIQYYVKMAEFAVNVIGKDITEANRIDIKGVRTALIAKRYGDNTYNKYMTAIKSFFDFVVYLKLNDEIDSEFIKKTFPAKKVSSANKFGEESMPTEMFENFYKFLFTLSSTKFAQRKKIATLIACGSGLRRVEIAELKREVIDFDNRCIDPNKTKFDKGRFVKIPLSQDILDEIRILLDYYEKDNDNGAYLFSTSGEARLKALSKKLEQEDLSPIERNNILDEIEDIEANGYHVAEKAINGLINNVCEMAVRRGILDKVYPPHALRKSRAKWMYYEGGYAISEIAELFGHSDESTTRKYIFDAKVIASRDDKKELSR